MKTRTCNDYLQRIDRAVADSEATLRVDIYTPITEA